jgi:hypothetical protein
VRKSKLGRFAANRIARPTEIRGAELAVKPEKLKADRAGKDFLTGENVVASRMGLDLTRGPRKLEKSVAHEQDWNQTGNGKALRSNHKRRNLAANYLYGPRI